MNALPVYRARIEPEWIDYNGHMRDAYYGLVLSFAVDAAMDHLGLDAAYRERTRCTLYTLELHIHYLHEIKRTDDLHIATSILDADAKRIHMGCRFGCARMSAAAATGDVLLLHVHQGKMPKSAAFPSDIARRIAALKLTEEARAAWGPRSRPIELHRRPTAAAPPV
jgi:acyl-CoA thioester hydrolase